MGIFKCEEDPRENAWCSCVHVLLLIVAAIMVIVLMIQEACDNDHTIFLGVTIFFYGMFFVTAFISISSLNIKFYNNGSNRNTRYDVAMDIIVFLNSVCVFTMVCASYILEEECADTSLSVMNDTDTDKPTSTDQQRHNELSAAPFILLLVSCAIPILLKIYNKSQKDATDTNPTSQSIFLFNVCRFISCILCVVAVCLVHLVFKFDDCPIEPKKRDDIIQKHKSLTVIFSIMSAADLVVFCCGRGPIKAITRMAGNIADAGMISTLFVLLIVHRIGCIQDIWDVCTAMGNTQCSATGIDPINNSTTWAMISMLVLLVINVVFRYAFQTGFIICQMNDTNKDTTGYSELSDDD